MKFQIFHPCALATLLLAGLCAGSAVSADESGKPRTTCIRGYEIDPTVNPETPDDRTIIFHMRNGDVWRNDLVNTCPGLRLSGGYNFTPTNPGTDEICSNLQSIRLKSNGFICMLGDFTRLPSKPKS